MSKTRFITGATRGFGAEIAQAAIRSGDRGVATGRNPKQLQQVLGSDADPLPSLALEVTDAAQSRRAVDAAVERFGGIVVLVNNAGYGHLGYFEENSPVDVQQQFATNVFGLWAVLPVMRRARRGVIFNLSSLAGIRRNEFASL